MSKVESDSKISTTIRIKAMKALVGALLGCIFGLMFVLYLTLANMNSKLAFVQEQIIELNGHIMKIYKSIDKISLNHLDLPRQTDSSMKSSIPVEKRK